MILNNLNEALKKSPDPAMTLAGFIKQAECFKHQEPVLYAGILKAAVSYVGKDYLIDCFIDTAWPKDVKALQKEAGAKVTRAQILTHIGHDLGGFLEKHAHAVNKKLFSDVIPGLKKKASMGAMELAHALAPLAMSPMTGGGGGAISGALEGALQNEEDRVQGALEGAKTGFKSGMKVGLGLGLGNAALAGLGMAGRRLPVTDDKDALLAKTLSGLGHAATFTSPVTGFIGGLVQGAADVRKSLGKKASMGAIVNRSKQAIMGKKSVEQKLSQSQLVPGMAKEATFTEYSHPDRLGLAAAKGIAGGMFGGVGGAMTGARNAGFRGALQGGVAGALAGGAAAAGGQLAADYGGLSNNSEFYGMPMVASAIGAGGLGGHYATRPSPQAPEQAQLADPRMQKIAKLKQKLAEKKKYLSQ